MPTVIAAILVSFTLCSFASTCQAEQARTVVILDATAQMAANLGQKRKFDWAKSGISGAASRMEPGGSFTLWAFGTSSREKMRGYQRAGSASGRRRQPAHVGQGAGHASAESGAGPGNGCLAGSAQVGRRADGKPVSAVLVAGTGDDCIGDICGAAGRLHGLYPHAKLTVLGMSMSEQASANFTCAAKAMGGAFIGVKSGADLERHLREAFGTAQTRRAAKGGGGNTHECR